MLGKIQLAVLFHHRKDMYDNKWQQQHHSHPNLSGKRPVHLIIIPNNRAKNMFE